jgi:hypothetical protein
MTNARQHLRLLSIAFVAIMGVLSTVGDAKASNTTGASLRECCLKRICTVCCCEPTSGSSLPETVWQTSAQPSTAVGLRPATFPCECRSSDPATPDSRHESRSVGERTEPDCGESVDLTFPTPAAVTLARLILPNASATNSPLYLRTARLLI